MTPVSWPPFLTVGHQGQHILFERFKIELLDRFPIIEVRPHGISLEVVLMEDVQVERLGPPVHVGHAAFCRTAVHDRTFAFAIFLQVTHCHSPQLVENTHFINDQEKSAYFDQSKTNDLSLLSYFLA